MREDKACILLADDDPDYLWLLKTHLKLKGYKVLVASDGSDALQQAATQDPDILILDVQMPDLDGCTACQRIRTFSNVPIILLSGLSTPEAIIRGLDAGADHYLTKPVSMNELTSRINVLLKRATYTTEPEIVLPKAESRVPYWVTAHP